MRNSQFWAGIAHLSKSRLPKHGISPGIILAFVRVPFLITCLACAGFVVNTSVVIMLHFLVEHSQKNMHKRGKVTAASKPNYLTFLLK